jgi:hypothetical protein
VAHSAARSGVEGVGLELARALIGRGDDEGTLGAGQVALKRRAVLEVPVTSSTPVGHGLPGAGEDTDFLPTIAQAATSRPMFSVPPTTTITRRPLSAGQSPKTNRTLPRRR